jgi:hypothetical protein
MDDLERLRELTTQMIEGLARHVDTGFASRREVHSVWREFKAIVRAAAQQAKARPG